MPAKTCATDLEAVNDDLLNWNSSQIPRCRSAIVHKPYIFGAICPAEGKGAGLILPSRNSEAMALHLEEISLAVAPSAHVLVLLDQAGWHVSKKLPAPLRALRPNVQLNT